MRAFFAKRWQWARQHVAAPRTWLLMFPALAAVVVILGEVWPKGRFLGIYTPNLAAELVGIALVVFGVDMIVKRQRERELSPRRAAAATNLRMAILHLVMLLQSMYKAAAPSEKTYDALDDLLDAWLCEAPYLDFLAEAPVVPQQKWCQQVGATLSDLEGRILGTLDRHPEALGTRVVVAAERLLATTEWSALKQLALVPAVDASMGFQRPNMVAIGQGPEGPRVAGEFIECVRELIDAYNEIAREPFSLPGGSWSPDSAPAWGESRFDPRAE